MCGWRYERCVCVCGVCVCVCACWGGGMPPLERQDASQARCHHHHHRHDLSSLLPQNAWFLVPQNACFFAHWYHLLIPQSSQPRYMHTPSFRRFHKTARALVRTQPASHYFLFPASNLYTQPWYTLTYTSMCSRESADSPTTSQTNSQSAGSNPNCVSYFPPPQTHTLSRGRH